MWVDLEILILLAYFPVVGVIYILDQHYSTNNKENSLGKAMFLACFIAPVLVLGFK